MKRILLLIIPIVFVSCSKSEGEQMLYDYQKNNVEAMNFDLKDLDFKIQKMEKISDVKASDSLRIIENNYLPVEMWETIGDSVSDVEKIKAIRHIFLGMGYGKETIDEALEIGRYYLKISKNPDSLLSVKYRANYSLLNPMLGNTKQTFDEHFYTNADQTKFVIREDVNGSND